MEKELNIIKMGKLNMMVILLILNMREKENIYLKMVIIILVSIKMVKEMEKELNIIKMVILNLKVILLMMNMKERGNI